MNCHISYQIKLIIDNAMIEGLEVIFGVGYSSYIPQTIKILKTSQEGERVRQENKEKERRQVGYTVKFYPERKVARSGGELRRLTRGRSRNNMYRRSGQKKKDRNEQEE